MTNYDFRNKADSLGSKPEYDRVRDASIRGAGVGVVTLSLKALIDFGSIIVLARLLTPADFGIVAMASTVLNLLRIVGDSGLVMASTQRLRLSEDQLSSLFWINTGVAACLCLLSAASAPLLVLIFGEPKVAAVTVVLSVTLLAIGVGAQHEAIMRRTMRYGMLHTLDVVSQAVGLATGVFLATYGMGLWSIVVYQVVARLFRTAWLWAATRWSPGKPRRCAGVMDLVRYGAQYVPIQLLAHASRGLSEVLVGVSVGASALGIYRRAHGIVMVIEQLKHPLKAMMPASLSRLQDQPQEFARFLLHSVTIWSIVSCCAIGFVISEATLVVRVLLGDQWLAAVPLIRALSLVGVATALGSAIEWVLLPLAEMKMLMALRALRAISVVTGVLIGWRWGVYGIAIGYSATMFVSVSLELSFVTIKKGFSFVHLWGPFLRAMLSAGMASIVVLMVPEDVPAIIHIIEFILYVIIFFCVHSMLPGGWSVTHTWIRAVLRSFRTVDDGKQ